MKKMRILGVCICLAMAGCTNFLEPKSSDEYIPENATSLDEMLVGEAYPLREGQSLFLFHNALDDDITITKEAVGFQDYEQEEMENFYAVYTLQPDMFVKLESQASNFQNYIVWDEYYERILGANAALDYVEDMNDDIEMKMFVKAQALALRGFYYFHLVNLFGAPYHYDKEAPGVPLKLSSDLEIGSRGRNSVGEVYAQIQQDFEASRQLFSVLPARRQFARNYRISLPAVRLLEARTYLFMGNWEKAIEQADALLSDPEFELYDLNDFNPTANNPKPHYSNYDNPEVIWLYGGTGDFLRFVNTLKFALGNNANVTRRFFNASPELLATYEEEDLRKEWYMLEEYDKTSPLGNKLAMGKIATTTNEAIDNNALPCAMSLRLSEAYLILAEAYAMSGDAEKSLSYLNRLRARRFAENSGVSGLSGEELIDFVRAERRRELCFEGSRWFDLRRWGMESFEKEWRMFGTDEMIFLIEKNDKSFTLPIPEKVLKQNQGLVQNPQGGVRKGRLSDN